MKDNIQEMVDLYIKEMKKRTEEVVMEALDHFQVNLEDIPTRCHKEEKYMYTEYFIDGKLVVTVDVRDMNKWLIEKHY